MRYARAKIQGTGAVECAYCRKPAHEAFCTDDFKIICAACAKKV